VSRAGEWARTASEPPAFFLPEVTCGNPRTAAQAMAMVNSGQQGEPRLYLNTTYTNYLSPSTALAFAHWIIDTFGEPAPSAGDGGRG